MLTFDSIEMNVYFLQLYARARIVSAVLDFLKQNRIQLRNMRYSVLLNSMLIRWIDDNTSIAQ